MMLIRKLARGRLLRLILARAPWASNGQRRVAQAEKITVANPLEEVDCITDGGHGGAEIRKRTTITVETERVLVVRTERRL